MKVVPAVGAVVIKTVEMVVKEDMRFSFVVER